MRLKMDVPLDGLFFAATFALLALPFASSSGQVGWISQSSPAPVDLRGVDLTDPLTGSIAGGQGAILRTTDGGAHWSQQSSGTTYGLRGISLLPGGLGIAVGEGGTILRTTDGGGAWAVIRTDWMDTFGGVQLLDGQLACAVGANAIFQPWAATSLDGGLNWTFHNFYIQGNEGGLTDVHFLDHQRGFSSAYLWDGRGAIVRTTDGGTNWSPALVTPAALWSIDFADALTGYACGDYGRVYRTTDGGTTWSAHETGIGVSGLGVRFPTPTTGWVVGQVGSIVHTTNAGSSWSAQDSGVAGQLFSVDFVDASRGAAVGADGTILWTVTGGMTGSGVPGEALAPSSAGVLVAFPNPFRSSTAIGLRAPGVSCGPMEIFDTSGRRVLRVERARALAEGGPWIWNGLDDHGRGVPPGVYFVRMGATNGPVARASVLKLGD